MIQSNTIEIGYQYELFIASHLKEKEKCESVWLWKNVPEKVLFEEDIITDYAAYSLVRNDIGIDILAKKDGKYIYVQCKNYSAGSICILDMAGYFFFKSAHQGKKCKLYYNGYLSNRIKLIHPNNDEFINVPFDDQINASWQIAQVDSDIIYEPRDYQLEAANLLKDKNRSILSIPCGMGKTYISTLLAKDHDNIVFFAPTKELCLQTYGVYKKQLKDYSCNLISGDGIRQIDRCKLGKKNIIVSTYKSCDIVNVLIDKLKNPYIIIDEFHNLSPNDILVEKNHMHSILNSSYKILFLSATPRYLNYKNIFGDTIYKYGWTDAINKGYINDFEIILPSNEYTAAKFEDFMDLFKIEKRDEMEDTTICKYIRKIYFLLRSILFNGNKKCIIFLPTTEIARKCESIITWMEKMFNVDIDKAIIDYETTKNNRKKIINNFVISEKISLLLNVHVLDEGINIPQCDSVFIMKPSLDLGNIVQRMSRCNRISSGKEKSTVYIWCGSTKMNRIMEYINDCTNNELSNKIIQIKLYQEKASIRRNNNIKKNKITAPANNSHSIGRPKKQLVKNKIDDDILKAIGLEENIGRDFRDKILDRISVLGIKKNKIDDYIRSAILDRKKFNYLINLITFLDEKKRQRNGIKRLW